MRCQRTQRRLAKTLTVIKADKADAEAQTCTPHCPLDPHTTLTLSKPATASPEVQLSLAPTCLWPQLKKTVACKGQETGSAFYLCAQKEEEAGYRGTCQSPSNKHQKEDNMYLCMNMYAKHMHVYTCTLMHTHLHWIRVAKCSLIS